MLNEPSPDRRLHPLEQRPDPPRSPPPTDSPRQQIMLHIPTVKPTVTYIMIGIMVAVFVLRAASPTVDEDVFLWGANNRQLVLNNGEFYRLISSMFLHASIYDARGQLALQNSLHLILNAYVLLAAGTTVEGFFGHWRYKILFLLGGISGGIASTLFAGANVFSVGASGAVFAVLGAEFVFLYKHRTLLGRRAQVQMRSLVWLALINFGFGLLANAGGAAMRIDNWAHFGGMIGGLTLAWLISPFYIVKRHPEVPTELLAEDINPLRRRTTALSLYCAALLVILIIASQVF